MLTHTRKFALHVDTPLKFHNYPKAEKLNVTQLNRLQIISMKSVNEKGKNIDLTRYFSNRFV